VALSILYYRNDQAGSPLISSVNRLAGGNKYFAETSTVRRLEIIDGHSFALLETTMTGPDGELLSWHWIRVGSHETTSAYLGKLWQARARMLMRAGDGAAVIATTPLADGKDAARAHLRAFLDANLAPIEAALAATERH
jgi:EpsI family protein